MYRALNSLLSELFTMDPSPPSMTVSVPLPASLIGPVSIAVLTEDQAVRRVAAMIDADGERIVAFCNAHSVNLARKNAELRNAFDRALVLNDGIGVDLARKWLEGAAFPANLAGTDFLTRLLRDHRTPLAWPRPPRTPVRRRSRRHQRLPRHPRRHPRLAPHADPHR